MLVISLIYLIQRLWLKFTPPAYDFYRIYDRFTTESWMIEFLGIGCDKAHCLFLSACETEQKKKKTQTEIKQERVGRGVRNVFSTGIEPWMLAERKERRRKSHSGMLRVTLWGPEIFFFWAETAPHFNEGNILNTLVRTMRKVCWHTLSTTLCKVVATALPSLSWMSLCNRTCPLLL